MGTPAALQGSGTAFGLFLRTPVKWLRNVVSQWPGSMRLAGPLSYHPPPRTVDACPLLCGECDWVHERQWSRHQNS